MGLTRSGKWGSFVPKMLRTALLWAIALLTPGGLVVASLWKLLTRLQLRPPEGLPLRGPSGAITLTREDWMRKTRAEHPIRFFLTYAMQWRQRRKLRRKPALTLPDMIFRFPFMALEQYVNQNRLKVFAQPPEDIDPLYEDYWAAMAEVRFLYSWWKEHDARLRALDRADPSVREYALTAYGEEQQLMLARLVSVRNRLV